MFRRVRFLSKVKSSLAALGIDPMSVLDLRAYHGAAAFVGGRTPEEAASAIFYTLSIADRPLNGEGIIEGGIREGKCDRNWIKALTED